ncbi:MAG: hypothetical protein ACYSWO_26575 [Planctomycetota bacterium]|jgi:hypothetical protein
MRFKQSTRNAFASQSSGASYPNKWEAIARFDAVLKPLGVTFRNGDVCSLYGDDGRTTAEIVRFDENGDETDKVEGRAVLTWYKLESGRWEIIGYLC